jgi:hypothetical protein
MDLENDIAKCEEACKAGKLQIDREIKSEYVAKLKSLEQEYNTKKRGLEKEMNDLPRVKKQKCMEQNLALLKAYRSEYAEIYTLNMIAKDKAEDIFIVTTKDDIFEAWFEEEEEDSEELFQIFLHYFKIKRSVVHSVVENDLITAETTCPFTQTQIILSEQNKKIGLKLPTTLDEIHSLGLTGNYFTLNELEEFQELDLDFSEEDCSSDGSSDIYFIKIRDCDTVIKETQRLLDQLESKMKNIIPCNK